MNRLSNILWGIAFVAIGILLILNFLGVLAFTLFFAGWWTLFLIIPSIVGLICEKNKMASLIMLIIGIVLLLCCQNVINWDAIVKLILPIAIIIIGIRLIFKKRYNDTQTISSFDSTSTTCEEHNVSFSSRDIRAQGIIKETIKLNATFGSIKFDLRDATVVDGAKIYANANFGGIEIFVPQEVMVSTIESGFFGGTSDKTSKVSLQGNPKITLITDCKFGGVEIHN